MKTMVISIQAFLMASLLFLNFASAQEAQIMNAQVSESPTQGVPTSEFASGTVGSVASDRLVVSEYDYEKDEEIENTYFVNQKTELKGVNSASEIAVDDSVDIVYSTVESKNIAQSIAVEKPSVEDDPPPVEQNAQPVETSE